MSFTNEWKLYTKTFTPTTDSTSNPFIMYNGWVTGATLYIKDFKLEEGSNPTRWIPSSQEWLCDLSSTHKNVIQAKDFIEI
jgi:hypothetical protein